MEFMKSLESGKEMENVYEPSNNLIPVTHFFIPVFFYGKLYNALLICLLMNV